MLPVLEHGRETVQYSDIQGVRFFHNDLTEDYPLHWHTATEIIAPTENDYTIEAGSEKYVLVPTSSVAGSQRDILPLKTAEGRSRIVHAPELMYPSLALTLMNIS